MLCVGMEYQSSGCQTEELLLISDLECDILGVKKINTSGYHPQTDGLVENSTCSCEIQKQDWDEHIHLQINGAGVDLESPFCLLYGRDPRVPTETVLSALSSTYAVDNKSEMMTKMSGAWEVKLKELRNLKRLSMITMPRSPRYELGTE